MVVHSTGISIMPHHQHELLLALTPAPDQSPSAIQAAYHLSILERIGIPHNTVADLDAIITASATSDVPPSEREMRKIMRSAHRVAFPATTMALWLDQRELQSFGVDPWTNPRAAEEMGMWGKGEGDSVDSWLSSDSMEETKACIVAPLRVVKSTVEENEECDGFESRPWFAETRRRGGVKAERRSDPARINAQDIDHRGYLIDHGSSASYNNTEIEAEASDTLSSLPRHQHPEATLIRPSKAAALLGLGPNPHRVSSSSSSFSSRGSTASSRSSTNVKIAGSTSTLSKASRNFSSIGSKASALLGLSINVSDAATSTPPSNSPSPQRLQPSLLAPLRQASSTSSSIKIKQQTLIPAPSTTTLVRRHSRPRRPNSNPVSPTKPGVAVGESSGIAGMPVGKGSWSRRVGGRVAARIAAAATGAGIGIGDGAAAGSEVRGDGDGRLDGKGSWRARGKIPTMMMDVGDSPPKRQPLGPREMVRGKEKNWKGKEIGDW